MTSRKKLVVILVDGLGADWLAEYADSDHPLRKLGRSGYTFERLKTDAPATSMPGRASLLTGRPTAEHGIYGNLIWDGKRFREASPSDVRAPTLATRAREAGLSVANIGMGMVSNADCSDFQAPYWSEPGFAPTIHAAYEDWLPVTQSKDTIAIRRVVELVAEPDCPDLILTEACVPDYYFHHYGCHSVAAQEAVATIMGHIGHLADTLESDGRFNLAVVSDHGFADVKESIHPDVLLSQTQFAQEGALLHVVAETKRKRDSITSTLAEHEVLPVDDAHLPVEHRECLMTFLAPPDCDFYYDFEKTNTARSRSRYKATHGFAPGEACDERFAVLAGPDVRAGLSTGGTSQDLTRAIDHLLF